MSFLRYYRPASFPSLYAQLYCFFGDHALQSKVGLTILFPYNSSLNKSTAKMRTLTTVLVMAQFPHGTVLLSCIGNLEHRRPVPAFHSTVVFDAIIPCLEQNIGAAPIICSALFQHTMQTEDVFEGTYEMVVKVQLHHIFSLFYANIVSLSSFHSNRIYTHPVLYDPILTSFLQQILLTYAFSLSLILLKVLTMHSSA